MKKCFVICPIGELGSEVRQRSDDVLEYIIEPALKELEVEPIRGDKFPEPGIITKQIIDAITNYDFCIADLSDRNPNVFYELAIAQAAQRPVILMFTIGEEIPFDVKAYRRVQYDLRPRNIMTSKWIYELRESVKSVLDPEFKPPALLSRNSLYGSESIKSYMINSQSKEFGDLPKYHEIVSSASKFCYLMGVSLKVWTSPDGQRVLKESAQRALPISILIMNANNPGLGPMINTRLPAEDLDVVVRQSIKMEEFFRSIMKFSSYGTFQVRTIAEGIPYFQLLVTDKTALVLQYMFCRGTGDSPLQQFPAGTELYSAFRKEFEDLWAMNEIDVGEAKLISTSSPREVELAEHPGAELEPRKPY